MPLSLTEGTVRFDQFELDLRTRQLTKNGAKIRLSQQPIQVLLLLLEVPGEIVTREEFRRRLWASDVFVDFDHGLNKSIQKLRDTLGDSAGSPVTSKPFRGSDTASLRSPMRRKEAWNCRQKQESSWRRLPRPSRLAAGSQETDWHDGFYLPLLWRPAPLGSSRWPFIDPAIALQKSGSCSSPNLPILP